MTITTVGYDLNPRTYLGKLIGGFTAISGIFILTLPIPIVVNSFASYYKAGVAQLLYYCLLTWQPWLLVITYYYYGTGN